MAIAQRDLICRGKGLYSTIDGQYSFIQRGHKWFVFDVKGIMQGKRAVPLFDDGHSSLLEAREFLRRKTGIFEYQA